MIFRAWAQSCDPRLRSLARLRVCRSHGRVFCLREGLHSLFNLVVCVVYLYFNTSLFGNSSLSYTLFTRWWCWWGSGGIARGRSARWKINNEHGFHIIRCWYKSERLPMLSNIVVFLIWITFLMTNLIFIFMIGSSDTRGSHAKWKSCGRSTL